ncbi:MAG: hypothetical protein ABI281_13025 [Caldimonas sp.]
MSTLSSASELAPGINPRAWATASHSEAADTSPGELMALGVHVDHCYDSRGRWFALRCAVDSVQGFMAPRLVTTIVVLAIVFGVISIVA